MSRKVSTEVSSINSLNDQQVEEQAPEGEESETPKREDMEKLTSIADVQYHKDLSKVTVHNKTPRGDVKEGTWTFREQVSHMIHIGDLVT